MKNVNFSRIEWLIIWATCLLSFPLWILALLAVQLSEKI